MEIQLVSFDISRFTAKERQFRIDSITKILNETAADFIMFSQHVLNNKEDLEAIEKNVHNNKIVALFELKESNNLKGNRLYILKDGSLFDLKTYQILATSQEATEDYIEYLIAELEQRRQFEVAGKHFLIFQCGENNILKGNSSTAEFRISNRLDLKKQFAKILDDADIILNPVHSRWSRYGCFLSRMRKFSEKKRYCFSCTRLLDERQLKRARQSPGHNVTQVVMHSKRLVNPIYTNEFEPYLLQSYIIE